MIYSKSETA